MKGSLLERNSTIINLVTGLLTMLTQLAVNFFLSPYIVRTLGEEANGFTQLASNFVSYATLVTLAFNSMAGRFMSVSYHQGNKKKTREYYTSVLVCNGIVMLFLLPIAIYLVTHVESLVSLGNADLQDVKILFSCVFANYFINQIASMLGTATFVRNKIYLTNILNLGRQLLNAVILLCLFAALPPKMYYVSLAALLLTIAFFPVYFAIKKKLLPDINFQINRFKISAVVELLKSGIWNTVNQCGNMLMTGMDLLLANLFIDATSMGMLSVAKTIPNAVVMLAGVLNTSFAPELTINWAEGSMERTLRNLRYGVKISSVMISIPVVVFCVFSVPFYRLWQPTLDANQLALLSILSMVALIPCSGTQNITNVFSAANKLKFSSLTFLLSGFLNIIVVYILLKTTNLGMIAVAGVSQMISMLRILFLMLPYSAKLLHQKWYVFYKDVVLSLCIAAITFVLSMLVRWAMNPSTWPMMVLSVGIAGLVSFMADTFLILSKAERNALLSKIARKRV